MNQSRASSAKVKAGLSTASIADIFALYGEGSIQNESAQATPELLSNLKLLDKKEPTTRSKALQEILLKVFPALSIQELTATVPFFFRAYKKGALADPDWKCRCLYHNCLAEICRVLGKSVEPHLVEVAPIWLLSMFDTANREVALCASKSFEAVFPGPDKRKKVFVHFSKELFENIMNVFSSEVISFTNPFNKATSSTDGLFEARETWERITCACLRCVLYLCKIHSLYVVTSSVHPLRHLIQTTPQSSQSVILCSVELALFIIENHPEEFELFLPESMIETAVKNLLSVLSVEEGSVWRVLSFFLSKVSVKTVKFESLIENSELRILNPSIFDSLESIISSKKQATRGLIPVFFAKIREAVSLDRRLLNKYRLVINGLIKCFIAACIANDSIAKLVDLFKVVRAIEEMRTECIKKVLGMVPNDGKTHLCEIVDREKDSVGSGILAILSPDSLVSTCFTSQISEVSFWLSYENEEPDSKLLAYILEELASEENHQKQWILDDRRSALSVLARISDMFPKMASLLASRLQFADRVDFVCSFSNRNPHLQNGLKSNPLEITVEDFKDISVLKAFLRAIDFESAIPLVADGARFDNGLIEFGSIEMVNLTSRILSLDRFPEFKLKVICALMEKRFKTGIEIILPNHLVLEAWGNFCDSVLDVSVMKFFLPLFRTHELLRTQAGLEYIEKVLLNRNAVIKAEDEVLVVLFPGTEHREILLKRILYELPLSENVTKMNPKFFQNQKSDYPLFLAELSRYDPIIDILEAVPEGEHFEWFKQVHFFLQKRHPFIECPLYDSLLHGLSSDSSNPEILQEFILQLSSDLNMWNLFVLYRLSSLKKFFSRDMGEILKRKFSESNSVLVKNALFAVLANLGLPLSESNKPQLPHDSLINQTIQENPECENRINAWVEACYAVSALNYTNACAEYPPLTFINTSEVSNLIVSRCTRKFGEEVYFRYRAKNLLIDEIDEKFINWLSPLASLDWALDALALKRNHIVLGRIKSFSLADLLTNKAVISAMGNESKRIALWTVILDQFAEEFPDADFLFTDYMESLTFDSTDEAPSFETIEERLLSVAVDCINGLQSEGGNRSRELLRKILRLTPTGKVHNWFSSLSKSLNIPIIEKLLVESGLSLSLMNDQIVKEKVSRENLKSNFSVSSKMLSCSYSSHGGEIQANLNVAFPDCWPLRLAKVEVSPVIGLSKAKNARLQVSIQSVFKLNGVQKAIRIWIENIEGFLSDVEECYICYSVTYHGTSGSGSIPSKQCRTCKNKFHSECLLKYFKTSGKTICCLCQNPF